MVLSGVFDNPILAAVLQCFAAGLTLAGLARLVPGRTVASRIVPGLAAPVLFLVSYVIVYQRVPMGDSPVDSIAKIFYLAVAGSLAGLVLDLVGHRLARRGLAGLLPLVVVLWIGQRRFAAPDLGLWLSCLGLWVGGAALLLRLDHVAEAEDSEHGAVPAFAILLLLASAFAPVALAGGSSTSLMLCLALAAGLGAIALWELALPRRSFTAATLFGAGGGFIAIIATVTLITREIDAVALVLLLLLLPAGQWGARLLLPRERVTGRLRQVLVGVLTAVPAILVIAYVLLRHPDAFSA